MDQLMVIFIGVIVFAILALLFFSVAERSAKHA